VSAGLHDLALEAIKRLPRIGYPGWQGERCRFPQSGPRDGAARGVDECPRSRCGDQIGQQCNDKRTVEPFGAFGDGGDIDTFPGRRDYRWSLGRPEPQRCLCLTRLPRLVGGSTAPVTPGLRLQEEQRPIWA